MAANQVSAGEILPVLFRKSPPERFWTAFVREAVVKVLLNDIFLLLVTAK